jgi:flagellar hook-associated protein 1 FlgK
MVLFTSLNTALSGLQSAMTALQVTGHNITNASTPGYSRQRVDLRALRPQDFGRFFIGRGVSVAAVTRIVDQALEGRLRDAASTLSNLGLRSQSLQNLEGMMGALTGSDVGALLTRLFNSLQDFANNPESLAARRQVLGAADSLARTLNSLSTQVRGERARLDGEVRATVDDVNRLSGQLAQLNREIVTAEQGGAGSAVANDLRDRRDVLLRELSDLVGIRAVETSNGEVNVMVGRSFLVFGGDAFDLAVTESADHGVRISTPVFAGGTAALEVFDGKLRGLLDSRDSVLADVARDLDVLAHHLAYEFNRVQSTGQGLERFSELTSIAASANPSAVLAIRGSATAPSTADTLIDSSFIGAADPTGRTLQILSGANVLETRRITGFDASTGTLFLDSPLGRPLATGDRFQVGELPFEVSNGGFDVVVTNEVTGLQQSFAITVDLDRVGADTTWNDIVAQIDAVPGVGASMGSDGRIRITSDSADQRFSFARDTSGFLAAAGLNAFFTGSAAADIQVNAFLDAHPEFLSGAQSNAAGDNTNALAFAALRDLEAIDGRSTFEGFYRDLVAAVGTESAEFRDRFETQALMAEQLENQRERVSGVNLDEEAVHMIEFQRAFQASARYVAVVDSLLDTLINGL